MSLTNHPYHNCSALIFCLPLIFRMKLLGKTCELLYFLPLHRATVYIMGIALGFVLRYCGRDFRLKKVCVRFEVICVVTVNIAVSCVVTTYVCMFWGYLFLPAAWKNRKSHAYKQPLQACCFPLVFSQTLIPIICSFYYYYFVPYMFQSSALKRQAVGPSVMFVSFYKTTWRQKSDDCILKQVWHCAMARGVGHYLLIVEVWVRPQACPYRTLKFSVVFRCRSQNLAHNLATVKTWP